MGKAGIKRVGWDEWSKDWDGGERKEWGSPGETGPARTQVGRVLTRVAGSMQGSRAHTIRQVWNGVIGNFHS